MTTIIQNNSAFLWTVAKLKTKTQAKSLFLNITSAQLKALVECIVNIPLLLINKKHLKCKNKNNLIKYFKSKKNLKKKLVVKYLFKNFKSLAILICCGLSTLLENELINVYNS